MSGAWKAVRCLGEDLKDLQMMSGAFEDVRDLSKVSGTSQRPSHDLRDLSQMSRASLFFFAFCAHHLAYSNEQEIPVSSDLQGRKRPRTSVLVCHTLVNA